MGPEMHFRKMQNSVAILRQSVESPLFAGLPCGFAALAGKRPAIMKKKLPHQRSPLKIMANSSVSQSSTASHPVATDRVSKRTARTVAISYTKAGKLEKVFKTLDDFLARSEKSPVLAK